jgi:diguanylate cyclase (GGDEF)-like protein/PAS domain S-box-containing protein
MTRTTEQHWELLSDLMSDGVYVLQDYRFVYVNYAFEQLIGARPGQLIGERFDELIAPGMRDLVVQRYEDRVQGKEVPRHYEVELQRVDNGKLVEAWLDIGTVENEKGVSAVAGTVRDIGPLKTLKQELTEAKAQLSSILNNMSDTVYQTNMEGVITFISTSVEALLGYSEHEMKGSKMAEYYWTPHERQKVVQAIIDNNGVITNVEAILKRKDGSPVWISTNAYVNNNAQGEPISIEGIARDVTRQKELEQKLEKLALTDSLTNLPNRRALMDVLHDCFMLASRDQSPLSVIYLDVNEFKKINDQHGHLMGDNLLRHIAATLKQHAPEKHLFGRLSGDEYLFILPGKNTDKAGEFARRLVHQMGKAPLQLAGSRIIPTLAVGISELKSFDQNEYSLLDRADKAMYLSKKNAMPFEIM